MKKSDLENGMIIVTKNAGNGMYFAGRIFKSYQFNNICSLMTVATMKENLNENNNLGDYEIVQVYRIKNSIYNKGICGIIEDLPKDCLTLVWEKEIEIDWKKVPKFTPVQVELEGDRLLNRYFLDYSSFDSHPFKVTKCDEFTFKSLKDEAGCFGDDETYVEVIESHYYEFWKKCKIHPSIEIKKEWYK